MEEGPLGRHTGTIYRFPPDVHSGGKGVHTFSIIESPNVDSGGYFGYAGPVTSGPVDLWHGDAFDDWSRHSESPIIDSPGLRWPTVINHDDQVYMIARRSYSQSDRAVFRIMSMNGRVPIRTLAPRGKLRLDLYSSSDGVEFAREGTLIDRRDTGCRDNSNPNVFVDLRSGSVGLVYHCHDSGQHRINLRIADSVPELRSAADTTLLSREAVCAAPAMIYNPTDERYVLLTEAIDPATGYWITEAYSNDRLASPFDEETRTVLFTENEACAFPFSTEDGIILFISRCTEPVPPHEIDAQWEGRLHRFSFV